MQEIKIKKDEIRSIYLEKRKTVPPDVKSFNDKKICERFMSLVSYRYADTILMYAPKTQEINVNPIAEHALSIGKTVCYPRCDSSKLTMDFHFVSSFDQLEKGVYGIYEPKTALPIYDIKTSKTQDSKKTVCIVPALVYDVSGYRLGYGKGYYDRYLSMFGGIKIGLIHDDFLIKRVPRGKYDLAVDVVITEKGVKALHA
jgi:5-formyltetrahydrofolate cyclo-ligase